MNKKFYLTTAIPYVNAAPHLGHALEFTQADVIARYHRLAQDKVHFLSGTDDNALKNVQAAKEKKIPVKKFVKQNSDKFYQLKKVLNLSFDDFIRTTEKRHLKSVKAFWQACQKNDIYKKKYQGLYCLGCEAFYTAKDLINGCCPEHKTKPEVVQEENYFFKLSKYQTWLEEIIKTNQLKITPETRKNEILAFIQKGLKDFSISRSKKRAGGWGIPVPGDDSQIIYVWFDALINYISALGWQDNNQLFKKFWPADVHVIGKGISRFHAIYWPAMLQSAGLALPKEIFIHGYVTTENQKISKSLGNAIDPFNLIRKYHADPVRYYILREIPAYGDGDFSEKRFQEVYNADLANGLGNLVARIAKLCENSNFSFKEKSKFGLNPLIAKHLSNFRFDFALESIWKDIRKIDKKINEEKIWEQKGLKLQKSLQDCVLGIQNIAFQLQPFLPQTARIILKQFQRPKIKSQVPLFPRLG